MVRYLGLDEDIVSIAVGKFGGLCDCRGRSLQDLKRAEDVKVTVIGGKVHESMTLKQEARETVELSPLYFQGDDVVPPSSSETAGCGCIHP